MSPHRALSTAFVAAILLSGCGSRSAPVESDRLPALFDCVRENNGMIVSAHRGGPVEGFAENALSTLKHGYESGLRLFEIDVSRSKDGVLFLLHDRTLQRTTNGTGAAINWDMDEIEYLQLRDNSGTLLDEAPPRLDAVLEWAVKTDALVQLDRKDPVDFSQLVRAIRDAGAQNHAILISYNDQQTVEIANLAPELMMSASVNSREHQAKLEVAGVDASRVIAWTGTRNPNGAAWRALARRNIESAFGTLGRPEERLDARYIADGDLEEYQDLADQGLHVLATDEPIAVADYLSVDDRTLETCWR